MYANELQDEIYDDDSWLRLVVLNKINILLDESLDYVWKIIYGKNRKSIKILILIKKKILMNISK